MLKHSTQPQGAHNLMCDRGNSRRKRQFAADVVKIFQDQIKIWWGYGGHVVLILKNEGSRAKMAE